MSLIDKKQSKWRTGGVAWLGENALDMLTDNQAGTCGTTYQRLQLCFHSVMWYLSTFFVQSMNFFVADVLQMPC
jgi:hypothetical protein